MSQTNKAVCDIYFRNLLCFLLEFGGEFINTVEPIRDKEKIKDMQDYLKSNSKYGERNYFLFCLMLYVPLRVSDIINLRVRDIKGKEHILKREKKTGKENKFLINKELKKIIQDYTKDMQDYEYLFKSQKSKDVAKPIERNQVHYIFSSAGKALGLENIGAHSPRKTFGYHHYQKFKNILVLMDIFNHSSEAITRRYCGINQDVKDKTTKDLSFK